MDERVTAFGDKADLPLNGDRVLGAEKYSAYLKIAEGCDNKCSYCAIPLIRGGFRSRKMEDILEEARGLAESGVKDSTSLHRTPPNMVRICTGNILWINC